jgi:type VI protein secretion system component VasK
MAAEAMTFLNIGRPSWDARVASHNSALLAQQRVRRRSMRTPECPFVKHIDNTRLVKASDPVREREMRVFSVVATILLGLVLVYGLQHFYAIESGYNVESSKQQLEQLREENRQLKLSEAQLTQPGRIDLLAREMGFTEPQPEQIVHAATNPENGAPVMAQVNSQATPVH